MKRFRHWRLKLGHTDHKAEPITNSPDVVNIAQPTRNFEYGQYAALRAELIESYVDLPARVFVLSALSCSSVRNVFEDILIKVFGIR
jgi:hypothetical protein